MPPSLAGDYYALLGVDAGADDEALSTAWRRLALQWDPEGGGDGATVMFQRIATAYAVLADPVTRAAYDRRRRAAAPPSPACTVAAPSPPPRATRPPAPPVMLWRLSGPLQSLMACGVAHLDEPGLITLVLREDEAAQGGMATISMRVALWCQDCAPQGRSAGCARCGDARTVEELFSAWIAVPPGVTSGEVVAPSVELPGMVEPVRFRVRLRGARGSEA